MDKTVKTQAAAEQTHKSTGKTKKQAVNLVLSVYGIDGKEQKTLELNKDIFDSKVNNTLLKQYVRVYLTNQRQGTVATKTRGEVVGSTKKIYRQKGTGRARHGAKKAPIFVGGGVTGGPQPKEYSLKMNSKQKKQALFSALTLKARNGSVMALSADLNTIEPKTKTVAQLFKTIGVDKTNALIVLAESKNSKLSLAARNLKSIEILPAKTINPFAILKHDKIVFVEDALQVLGEHFKS